MSRYYFHQRIDGDLLIDPEGNDYADFDAARASALASARLLWAAAIVNGADLHGQAIEIEDENGVLFGVVPFADALPPFLWRQAA